MIEMIFYSLLEQLSAKVEQGFVKSDQTAGQALPSTSHCQEATTGLSRFPACLIKYKWPSTCYKKGDFQFFC